MNAKPGMDLSGALMLIAFSALIAFNQLLVKQVNAGMAPLFQAGMRSAFAIIPVAAQVKRIRLTRPTAVAGDARSSI